MQKVLDFSNVLRVILVHETIVFLAHSQTASKHINRSNFQSINFNSLVYKHLVLLLNNAQINYAFSIIIEKVEKINWIRLPLSRSLERVWISNQISPFCPQSWFHQEQSYTSCSVAKDLDEHADFFVENERDLGGMKTRICTVPKRVGNPWFTGELLTSYPWLSGNVDFYPSSKILRRLTLCELKISFWGRSSIYKYVNSWQLGTDTENLLQTPNKHWTKEITSFFKGRKLILKCLVTDNPGLTTRKSVLNCERLTTETQSTNTETHLGFW